MSFYGLYLFMSWDITNWHKYFKFLAGRVK